MTFPAVLRQKVSSDNHVIKFPIAGVIHAYCLSMLVGGMSRIILKERFWKAFIQLRDFRERKLKALKPHMSLNLIMTSKTRIFQ